MPRGGKRAGAGRKPGSVLSFDVRFDIGLECESRWETLRDERAKAERAKLLSIGEYNDRIAEVQAIPVADRAAYLASYEYEYHASDVEEACRSMAGMNENDEGEAPTVFRPLTPRPYAQKAAIIESVATWASDRFSQQVSHSAIKVCWTEYCSFISRLNDDN